MPKKILHNFQITHILADGTVLTNEEHSKKTLCIEENLEFIEDLIQCFDKNYKKRSTVKFERELVKHRRDKLERQMEQIEAELKHLE